MIVLTFLSIVVTTSNGKAKFNKFEYDQVFKFKPQCGLFGDPSTSIFPCPQPPDLESSELPTDSFNVDGYIFVNDESSESKVVIFGDGFPISQPTTIWIITLPAPIYNMRLQLDTSNPLFPHPIWQYIMPAPAIACVPTTVGFNNGRNAWHARNIVNVDKSTRFGYFEMDLDYNLLKWQQVPLPNVQSFITQDMFPDESIGDSSKGEFVYNGLHQNVYQNSGKLQFIARDFLRFFNSDGTQKYILDSDNNAKSDIVRSPLPAYMIAVATHLDGLTHGNSPGVQFNPAIEIDPTLGDHYELAVQIIDNIVDVTDTFKAKNIKTP